MNRKVMLSIFLILSGFVLAFVYADHGQRILSLILRWGEIIIVLSLFAGLLKFLLRELRRFKNGNVKEWSSGVILLSFTVTFLAGILNFNESKYTFNNIVRERPSYLLEISDIIIGDDSYLSRFPARKKLAIYLSASVSPYFFPTEEMLKSAGMSNDEFSSIRYGRSSFSGGTEVFINEDDIKLLFSLENRTRDIAVEAVSVMLPVSEKLKEWFIKSVTMLEDNVGSAYSDLTVGEVTFPGSGDILKKWFIEQVESKGGIEINEDVLILHYADFIGFSGVSELVSKEYSKGMGHDISKNGIEGIFSAFLKTGVTSSPKMKGFIRWIYRSVFDPLMSTFMALLFFSMMIAAYKKLNFRNYSYFVVSLAVCAVIIGFFPYLGTFAKNFVPDMWKGPFSQNWLINSFAGPVFKAFAIGTGAGFMFHAVETVYDALFFKKGENKK